MNDERDPTTLRRIANVLGVSIEYFSERRLRSKFPEEMDTQLQVAELLEAFADITDPQARRECIEYVRGRQSKACS